MKHSMKWIGLVLLLQSVPAMAQHSCIQELHRDRLYGRERAWTSPAAGAVVRTNPPVFLWPAVSDSGVRYYVRISRDRSFVKGESIKSDPLPWAAYSPHRPLSPGRWYWQYGLRLAERSRVQWFAAQSFQMPEKARSLPTPSFTTFFQRCTAAHPRLWLKPEALVAFRERTQDNPEARQVIREADTLLGAPLPEVAPVHLRDTSNMSDLNKALTVVYMYHGFGPQIAAPLKKLALAYLLTGKQQYAREGIRRALHIAALDPKGVATRDDFNSGACMEAMAIAWDRFHALLKPEEKTALLKAITVRAEPFYEQMVNNFETKLCDNHFWQHIFREFVITSVAVAGDIKAARQWLEYAYTVWSTRFPVLGTTDGGWFEGNGYFPVHFETLIYLPLLFGQYTGIDYFNAVPWFRNLPFYMLYTFPAGSASTAVGDKHESLQKPTKTWVAFADALAREAGGPWFQQYAAELVRDNATVLQQDDKFLLYRLLRYGLPDKTAEAVSQFGSLPRAHVFKDVGLAVAHTHLSDPKNDLMVSLNASPFGSVGHAHAAQNALTVNWGGRTLFGGSGYYSNFSDAHNLLHYRTTRAYCSILADSIGQSLGEYGYGWITRSLTGKNMTYFAGDASQAYSGHLSDFWLDRLNRRQIPLTAANGFGNAGVTKFRRHVLTIKKNIIVVYDVLEADHPVKWTWQLHSPDSLEEANIGKNSCIFKSDNNGFCRATVQVFAPVPVTGIVHDKFNSPAINWKGKEKNGKILTYKKQWHGGVTSKKTKAMRFLSVFVVGNKKVAANFQIQQLAADRWKVGKLLIRAGMKTAERPFLYLTDQTGTMAFGYNMEALELGGKKLSMKRTGTAALLERLHDGVKVIQACDTLPRVVQKN